MPALVWRDDGALDWDAMRTAYDAEKRDARRAGWRPDREPVLMPRNHPFFPDAGE